MQVVAYTVDALVLPIPLLQHSGAVHVLSVTPHAHGAACQAKLLRHAIVQGSNRGRGGRYVKFYTQLPAVACCQAP
jgi:hypothetical protein